MKKTNLYYSPKLEQFNKFSHRLNKMIDNGTFYRLSTQKRNMLICRLKRLYNQLLSFIPEFKLKHILAAAAALVLSIGAGMSHAQTFDPVQTNPFGLTSIGYFSAPAFIDIDGDGDFDAFVGGDSITYGSLQYFENVGTNTSPAFTAPQTNPFGLISINSYIALPTFVDIDGDGDFDAFVGNDYSSYGGLQYFENTGTNTAPAFAAPQTNPFGLSSLVGYVAVPAFVDMDGDGDFDLIAGGDTITFGSFQYFQNTGTDTVPSFTAPQTNPFGLTSINGVAIPAFADIDGDGDFDALVGNDNNNYGGFQYFENTGTNTAPAFAAPQSNPFGLISVNYIALPAFADIDDDGDFDLFAGEYYGAIKYFENTSLTGIKENDIEANIVIYPNPANGTFNISIQGKNESEDMALEIINSIGQTMLKEQIEALAKEYYKEINTADFAKGLYFIKLSSKNSIITRKLIIL
ncbi:T9SS type A sorting domain-containing protein [bacterium AH-315-M05]|nr:T9SS type A sorting domain-containing protein [bacterium AH-315-M05]